MRFPLSRPAIFAAISLALTLSSPSEGQSRHSTASQINQIAIPGPLRSFVRMAGVSREVSLEDVLPTLARNVYMMGYPSKRESEYMVLLQRYVQQARALQMLASNDTIRVARCEDAGPLLQVLGYRLRNPCGQKDVSLVTSNPESAFLTIDSGFPLTQLEEAIQNNTPFTYAYAPTRVPVLLHQTDWTNLSLWARSSHPDLLDVLLHDPQVARLYWGFSRIDPDTGLALVRSPGLVNLLPMASVMDFYGTQLCIRSKKVVVPGGPAAESAWKDLVGASPAMPGEFVTRLLSEDRGWLAAYFDTLARLDRTQQEHLTQGPQLRNTFEAFRGPDPRTSAAGAAFRRAPALLVLLTRQRWKPNGEPIIPGNLDTWREISGKGARRWDRPEDVLEHMVALSRLETDNEALQVYLTLSELDNQRSPEAGVSPDTMLLMAHAFADYSAWYPVFSEFPQLDDAAITRFIRVAEELSRIPKQDLRGDALGTFQANLGLWQILARQGEIPKDQLASSWQKLIDPFEKVSSPVELLDAGEKSLNELMISATGKAEYSQDQIISLLAAPPQENSQNEKVRTEMAERIRSVMDDQRLTSLDTLFALSHEITAMEHGTPGAPPSKELLKLTGELREFEMPRRIFSESEKDEWAPGIFSQRHAELQMHTDLAKAIGQSNSPQKLDAARGQLAPFLRDTLVGLNYAYYEPPGSQILHINPLFVRSHDFAGETVGGIEHVWQVSSVFAAGSPAGGGAYLVGSLADLAYVEASVEQDFIAPTNVQALIWQETVPGLLAGSVVSRWWNVSPHELHAVALYQKSGEELLAASVGNQQLREKVVAILADRISPLRASRMELALQSGDISDETARLLPADSFYLGTEFHQRYPQEPIPGAAAEALDKLTRQYPEEVSVKRISKDLGIPHPTLAQTYGRELLNVKPFPAFSGQYCRSFGESWDSSNLYWARMADERGVSPATLNLLSPQLTHLMISRIFASHYEDWPAVVRAMHEVGDEFLQGKLGPQTETATISQR
jgi:hypothetical protein